MTEKPTILIADDDRVARDLLDAWLRSAEMRVEMAANGREALEMASRLRPDIILLDVMMPGLDGFEVCRRLRAEASLAEVPIILVTALNDRNSRMKGIEAGADDFVSKPYDGAELKARVKTIARLNRYRRLLAERTKFEWVVESADEGYLLLGEAGRVLYANSAARRYLGRDADEAAAIAEPFLDLASRQYLCEPREVWKSWPKPSVEARYLVRPETIKTSSFWLRVETIEVPAQHGDETGHLVRLRDETSRVALQRDMWKFNALISHKLRTPLTVILGGFELLERDLTGVPKEELEEVLTMASDSARRLKDQLFQILSFLETPNLARVSTEGFELEGLGSLTEEIAAELELELQSKDLDGGGGRLVLSSVAFEMVLRELLANAKKFHPEGRPRVDVRLTVADKRARLTVRDDGVRVPAELVARVWSPYFQGEKGFSGNVEGMGLGLSMVASLVWGVGGSCRLYNREDRPGVGVELVIPVVE